MLRHETRTQETAQQSPAPHRGGLLSEAIATLQTVFPHPPQSLPPTTPMEQCEVLTTVKEDLPNVQSEDFGYRPQQALQQQQSQPCGAAQPGQHTVPGRRPLFGN